MASLTETRLKSTLQVLGLEVPVVTFTELTHTAEAAAAALDCPVAAIAKSLILHARRSDQALLAIMSGGNRIDTEKLSRLAGEKVRLANADFVRQRTGYVIGGVPPIHSGPILTFIDDDLFFMGQIWASAGSACSVFATTAQQLLEVTNGQRAKIKA